MEKEEILRRVQLGKSKSTPVRTVTEGLLPPPTTSPSQPLPDTGTPPTTTTAVPPQMPGIPVYSGIYPGLPGVMNTGFHQHMMGNPPDAAGLHPGTHTTPTMPAGAPGLGGSPWKMPGYGHSNTWMPTNPIGINYPVSTFSNFLQGLLMHEIILVIPVRLRGNR